MSLLFNKTTLENLDRSISNPSHALLLCGLKGSGKETAAKYLIEGILSKQHRKNIKYLDALSGDGISQIREIRKFLSLKTTGTEQYKRIILLKNIESLGHESQNALLKNIEEPPEDTIIILTTSNISKVLSTILSRVTNINILPISEKVAMKYGDYSESELKRAYLLSDGLADTFIEILENTNNYLVDAVDMAKIFLKNSKLERLILVDTYSKNKDSTIQLIIGIEKCYRSILQTKNTENTKSIIEKILTTQKAIKSYENNVNNKLLLTSLAINL